MNKILIVEDEMIVAEDIADYLKRNGYHVTGIALSAAECFDLIEKDIPDVILMDIRLQGETDGVEAAIQIYQTKKIPVIFITANSDDHTITKIIEANPQAFISKPFNIKDIQIAIELVINKTLGKNFDFLRGNTSQVIFVKNGSAYKKINISDILYVEADGSYSIIYTRHGSFILTSNLNHVYNQINNVVIKRIHRSYLVNITNVDGFDSGNVLIQGQSIPISKKYQKEFQEVFPKI